MVAREVPFVGSLWGEATAIHEDLAAARAVSAAAVTHLALRYARQLIGTTTPWVFLRGDAAGLALRNLPTGCSSVALSERADGRAGVGVLVGNPPKAWLEQIVAVHERQAIGCDAAGEMWLIESGAPDQRLGSFCPDEIVSVFECVSDLDEVRFDIMPEAFRHERAE